MQTDSPLLSTDETTAGAGLADPSRSDSAEAPIPLPRVSASIHRSSEWMIKLGSKGVAESLAGTAEAAIPSGVLLMLAYAAHGSLTPSDITLAALIFFLFAWRLASFPSQLRSSRSALASSWVTAVTILGVLSLITGALQKYELQIIAAWLAVGPPLHWIVNLYRPGVLAAIRRRRPAVKVIVVGSGPLGSVFSREAARDRLWNARLLAYFDANDAQSLTPTVGGQASWAQQIKAYVTENAIDQVFLALPLQSNSPAAAILKQLRDTTASVFFVPDLQTFDLIQARVDIRAGFPVVSVCDSPFRGLDALTKRLSDVVIAGIGILIAAPIMIVAAIAIKVSSPGPIIFRQKRYGLDGEPITVYKFRSMRVMETGEAMQYRQTVRGDPRLTPVGAFIRKTSIDELPQLINVLQGRMSLVGPRPHVAAVNEKYRGIIDGYMIRHKVKPGITGWAQVHGFRGGDDLPSMRMRVAYDIDYLRRWSIWLDLYIIIRTVIVIFRDSKAF